MVRLDLLKAAMEDRCVKPTAIARKIGLSRATFRYRLNGTYEFKASEIDSLCRILHLSTDERNAIFFEE